MENKLKIFTNELLKWNRVHKFTNYNSEEEIKEQIEDSLFPLEMIKDAKKAADIGTGAGFPGMVLAIAMPDTQWFLVEPLKKRYSFLNYIKVKLGLKNVKIIPERMENSDMGKVDLITTRAVMPTKEIIQIAKPFLEKDGKMLLYKGSNISQEIKNLDIKYDLINRGHRNYLLIKGIHG